MKYTTLTPAFPGKSNYGPLGISAVVLVETNGKKLLFDTGAHGAVKILLNALQERNISPAEIDYVFLSHLHFDHVANIGLFSKAVFLIGQQEWETAFSENREVWTPPESLYYLKEFCSIRPVQDGEWILPDVQAIATPGHTPGHMSLLLYRKGEIIALTGDAVKNRTELITETVDQSLDREASTSSIKAIKSRANLVIPGHDCALRVCQGNVIPQEDLLWEVTLPLGFSDGNNGRFSMPVRKELN